MEHATEIIVLILLAVLWLDNFRMRARIQALEKAQRMLLLRSAIDFKGLMESTGPWLAAPSERVREIAKDPKRLIEAIKVYRQETGADLKQAKDAVQALMAANSGEGR